MILNLGCGKRHIKGAVNVDIQQPADEIIDLTILPWKWKANSISCICMYHFLEHTPNPLLILNECYRVLVKNGILDIHVPHSSSASANGCLKHYRTFSYNSIKDVVGGMFDTIHQRIVWLPHYEWVPIQWFIDLSPRLFERVWCYWVGGATEVQWKGVKI